MFIAVCTYGGIIDHASVHNSIEEAKTELYGIIKNYGFDPECDDAKVFQQDEPGGPSEEVYSYTPEMFIAVYVYRGIIDHVSAHNSMEKAVDKIRSLAQNHNFNPDYDDARVFQQESNGSSIEVYSYDPDEENENKMRQG